MSTTSKLTGQVAEILNARELVINLGHKDGVKQGMKFKVVTDPLEVKDPTTGELLDTLVREKTRVEVRVVKDRISICRTYRKRKVPRENYLTSRIPDITNLILFDECEESFSVQDESAISRNSYAEEFVKKGDRVVLLDEAN